MAQNVQHKLFQLHLASSAFGPKDTGGFTHVADGRQGWS